MLFPYLLGETQNPLIDDAPEDVKSTYKSIDYIALSVMGEMIIKKWKLPSDPSGNKERDAFLKCAIEPVREWLREKHERKERSIWRPIFEALSAEVERRRVAEARIKLKKMRKKEKNPKKRRKITLERALDSVKPRNIIVKMHYDTDPTIRKNAMRNRGVKALGRELLTLFPGC